MSSSSEDKQFQSLAPVLIVDTIEPCVAFWQDRLGFTLADQVAEGDTLGFAILVRDGVTLMYQSQQSLENDLPAVAAQTIESGGVIYISVASIDEVERRLEGVVKLVPRRTTFYGAKEIGVREPGGAVVMFAERGSDEP